MSSRITGVMTALVTPFKNGEIDTVSIKRLVRAQLDQGIQGFVVNGTTAESPTLTHEEVWDVFALVKSEVSGQVPLIVGTGSNATESTAEWTREVSRWQPDGVLVVVPYYNKPPQRGLKAHFESVAAVSGVPIYLYNVPSRTVANLEPDTAGDLSQNKNIAGIKDATGNMDVFEALKRKTRAGFTLLSGDDSTCVEFCARGGHGVISVSSHIIGAEMRQAIADRAVESYKSKYAVLLKWLYIEANPIPVKMALHWMGLITSPELRLPLMALDEKFHQDFKSCLKEIGKI